MKKMKTTIPCLVCLLTLSLGVGCSTMKPTPQFEVKGDPPLIRAVRVAMGHVVGTPFKAELKDNNSEENPLVYFVTIVAAADQSIHQVIVNADSLQVVGEQPVLP